MTMRLRRTHTAPVSLAHLAAIVIVGLSVFLIVDFGIRAASLFQVNQKASVLEAELAQQRLQRDRLQQRLGYVQSDAYVEEVARKELKWSRPGDRVVVIMSPPSVVPAVTETDQPPPATATTPEAASWLTWWFLFFDVSPPRIF